MCVAAVTLGQGELRTAAEACTYLDVNHQDADQHYAAVVQAATSVT